MLAAAHSYIDLNHASIRANEPVTAPVPSNIQRQKIAKEGFESIEFSVRNAIYQIKFINDWATRSENSISMDTNSIVKKKLPITLTIQEGNTCGPTSLYMCLRALGVSCTQSEVEKRVLCSPLIGTSPVHIKSAVSEYGLHAAIRNNATTQTIKNIIDSGGYAIALLQKPGGLHYVVINGYQTNADHKTEYLIADPNGTIVNMSDDQFSGEWSNLHLRGIDLGFNHLVIAVTKEPIFSDSLQGKPATLSILHGLINQFTNLLGELFQIFSTLCSALGSISAGSIDAIPANATAKKIKDDY